MTCRDYGGSIITRLHIRTPATAPIWFIKPTQHKPPMRVKFPQLESAYMWSLALYKHCFKDNTVKNKILSEPKLSVKTTILSVRHQH
jgi:hypothetical protein